MSDWKQLYAEVSDLAPPARLGYRIHQLAATAPTYTRASRAWAAARGNRGRAAELAAALIATAVLVVAIHGHNGSGQPPARGAGPGNHRVSAHGVSLALPPDFHVVKPASPGAVSDPQTLIVVGTEGVHAIRSQCQIASYHVPSQGAVIVIIRWQSTLDAGGSGGPGIAALRKLRRVEQPTFECYSGRGAAVQFRSGGHPYQVNVMVGDHATAGRVAKALAVARSLRVSRNSAHAGGMVRIPTKGNTDVSTFLPRLDRLGLRIAIPTPWRTNSFSAIFFSVISPAPGTRVPRGSVVTLQTDGLPGIPWSNSGHHVVPIVLNTRLDEATARISAAGLPWLIHAGALPPTLTSDLFSSYCVSSQTPAPGVHVTTRQGGTQLHEVKLTAKPC